MKSYRRIFVSTALMLGSLLSAQPWLQNDTVFNSSGVPSLPFSQPRFADLDGDGDPDLILGSIDLAPVYLENTGTATQPAFSPGAAIFSGISPLDAEMGVCGDLDADADLDFITGGYTGLHFYQNTGTVSLPVFSEIPGYFNGLNTGSCPVPALADVDADGDLDLVVGTSENGSVKLYFNQGDPVTGQFNENEMLIIGDVGLYAYPVFCDIDNDNDQDLLAGRDIHGFVYFENMGNSTTPDWQVNTAVFTGLGSDTYWNSPALTDLNGDGTFDLIYGTAAGPLHYYQNTGTPASPLWQENTVLFGGVLDVGGASNPFFHDFDGDGDLDLISGSQLGDIKYYRNTGTASAPAWEDHSDMFVSIDHSIYSAATAGDVNGDGQPDLIVGDLSGQLFYHRNTGHGFIWETAALSFVNLGGWSSPRLLLMDEDDDLDIVAGNEAGNLFYFENVGSATSPDWVEIPGFFGGIDVGTNCVPTLADLDFDGDWDILTGDISGQVQFFENQAGNWVENPVPVAGLSGGQNTTPACADLDGDGDPDLCLGNYSGTFSYFENQQDFNSISTAVIPSFDFQLGNNPNPFNPRTTISFRLPANCCRAELLIYNSRGQLVLSQTINPSTYEPLNSSIYELLYAITWPGIDKYGQPVASGVYFSQVRTPNMMSGRHKMLLLK